MDYRLQRERCGDVPERCMPLPPGIWQHREKSGGEIVPEGGMQPTHFSRSASSIDHGLMAATDLVEVQCPACRARQDVLLTSSINVTTHPEEKEMIIAGTINYFRCRSCSYEGHIATSLFYHDMAKKFCACYIPPENLEDEAYVRHVFTRLAKINLMLPDGEKTPAGAAYVADAHVVFTLPELARYVLFRDRIDEVFTGGCDPGR